MKKIDLTYSGKLKTLINITKEETLDVDYTIDGESGNPTTTSIFIINNGKKILMITFDYQDLKKLVGDI